MCSVVLLNTVHDILNKSTSSTPDCNCEKYTVFIESNFCDFLNIKNIFAGRKSVHRLIILPKEILNN